MSRRYPIGDMSRQSLKYELRKSIWASISQRPEWASLSHKRRKAICKQIFDQIWSQVPDKRALAEGLRWAQSDAAQLVAAHMGAPK
jgi:hypothetical protein